ncbi:hypothetical protein EII34_08325 [Arachnia propionica]|uniref:YdbS-like PH domain-containing protein n=2 Tax=Arachnia propionica TaxID=1750 RepID=A0A3P1T6C3_9ACTN|nr:hypothetical protein EII34_08325 [Arachnia propionica]
MVGTQRTGGAAMEAVDGAGLRRLPAAVRGYWVVTHLVWIAVVAVVGLGVVLGLDWSRWWLLVPAGIVVVLCLDLLLIPLRHAHHGYRVNAREVFITRGRLIRHSVTVATPKILNAEVSEGPIQRRFGLATVTVNQVVGDHGIGPIRPEEAEHLRLEILAAAEREEP